MSRTACRLIDTVSRFVRSIPKRPFRHEFSALVPNFSSCRKPVAESTGALFSDWRKLLRRCRADLVHSHNWGTFLYAVLAAKLAGVRIVHGEHGKNVGEIDGDGAAKRMVKRTLGRRVERIVTVCQSIAEEWIACGIPEEKVLCIPNGVDTGRFHPRDDAREFRKQFGLPESVFLVGSIGRLDELKNYDVLIAALGLLKDSFSEVHLAILGDGPRKDRLKALAEDLGLQNASTC